MRTSLKPPPPWLRRFLLKVIDVASRPLCEDTSSDPYHVNFRFFVEEVKKLGPCNVLELGARKSTIRSHFVGCKRYVGVDIHSGPDVDVTCDIHELATALSPLDVRFDAVATISTFEHLVVPWKAILKSTK